MLEPARPWLAVVVALSLVLIRDEGLSHGNLRGLLCTPIKAQTLKLKNISSSMRPALRPIVCKQGTRLCSLRASSRAPIDKQTTTLVDVNPPAGPPPRSIDLAGYRAPDDERTWDDFCYASPQCRREVAAAYAAQVRERSKQEQRLSGLYRDDNDDIVKVPSLPPMTVVLIGGPCSGKGTIAPMLSQAFRTRVVGVGQLLRGELRAGTPRGLEARALMQRGELLDDDFVVSMLASRVSDSWDAKQNGVLLDGFPRSTEQAVKICGETESGTTALKPDCVIVLERPDELVKEFALGRMTDSATGQTYHPIYAPPPDEVQPRLVWRLDDTPDVIEKRCRDFRQSVEEICEIFAGAGVPVKTFNNARSELDTFAEVARFVEDTGRHKLREAGGWYAIFQSVLGDLETVELPLADQDDVLPMCDLGAEGEDACLERWKDEWKLDVGASDGSEERSVLEVEERYEAEVAPLLRVARRCNSYDASEYVPVLVGDEQVGYASASMMKALDPYLAQGHVCELVRLREDGVDPTTAASGHLDIQGFELAVRLAPEVPLSANTGADRSGRVAALVKELVADGVIAASALRNELQDVRPMLSGFLSGPAAPSPLLRMERAAMIYFGVPSFGVHLNGYVRDANSGRPAAVWIARRSMSKATYPGLLDQMVAGGQPAGMSFQENIRKESEEEASLPPDVVRGIVPTGLVSYKYSTRKGLSTKVLATFDVAMPDGMSPICSDGEVDEFTLMPIDEALASIREKLPIWKPNSALIMLDFAVRHGFVTPDEPGYAELNHLLRAGLSSDQLRRLF